MNFLRNPWIVIGLIAVMLVGGAIWYSSGASATYNEGVVITPHQKGNKEAKVQLVEYSDFQCPACAQFQPVVAELLATYGDQLSFEYRHFPLMQIHRLAEPAARAAEAAGQQGKFFEYHDLLFVNQGTWSNSTNPAQYFLEYAKTVGLDTDQFLRQQRSSIIRNHIQTQFAEARDLGFTGTPSFLLNGEKMTFQTFDEFKAQIEAAINPNVQMGTMEVSGEEEVNAEVNTTAPTAAPAVRFGL